MKTNPQEQEMLILGIDPGTKVTGYGLIKVKFNQFEAVDYGCIRPPQNADPSEKYLIIFNSIEKLLETYAPHAVAVETQFMYKNAQSSMKLGMARGMAILAAARGKISLYEYAPRKAKLAVVGNGAASKEQVQKMVQLLLNLPHPPHPEDAADALALAICHAQNVRKHVRIH